MAPSTSKRTKSPTNVMDFNEWSKHQFNDVHTKFSALLRAYAVFQPAPPSRFPLFQVGLVLPEPARRAWSPMRTHANLHTIFSYLQSGPQFLQPSQIDAVGADVIQAFLHEFGGLRDPSPLESLRNTSPTMTVSEASLVNAGIDVSAGPSVGASIGVSKEHTNVWKIKLSDISSEEYAGGPLRRLIWAHAEFVFRQILREIDTDIGVRVGDRNRIAIMTGRFIATAGISKTKVHAKSARAGFFGAPSGNASGHFKSEASSEESYDDHRGICGLHFIVFPVEVIDNNKWRVYRGIDVSDGEYDDPESSVGKLSQSQRWHLGQEKDLSHCRATDHQDVSESSAHVPSATISSRPGGSGLGDSSHDHAMHDDGRMDNSLLVDERGDSEGWIDVFQKNFPAPWVDIDIGAELDVFAMQQCDLANRYGNMGAEGQEKRLSLLRSAVRKCQPVPALRALSDISDCYARGDGIPRSQNDADLLQSCVRMWRNHCSSRLALEALRKDHQFLESREPERHILRLMTELKNTCDLSDSMPIAKMHRVRSENALQSIASDESKLPTLQFAVAGKNSIVEDVDDHSQAVWITAARSQFQQTSNHRTAQDAQSDPPLGLKPATARDNPRNANPTYRNFPQPNGQRPTHFNLRHDSHAHYPQHEPLAGRQAAPAAIVASTSDTSPSSPVRDHDSRSGVLRKKSAMDDSCSSIRKTCSRHPCPQCGKVFKTRSNMLTHTRYLHTDKTLPVPTASKEPRPKPRRPVSVCRPPPP